VIVRIATEGQYELSEESRSELGELDNQVVAACQSDDEDQFRASFGRLLDFVRTQGRLIDDDQLTGSDLIVPPPDISVQEAREEFSGEGLIPG
jgi:hypothetical protein